MLRPHKGYRLPEKRMKMKRRFPPIKDNRTMFIFGRECRPSVRAIFAPWSVAWKFVYPDKRLNHQKRTTTKIIIYQEELPLADKDKRISIDKIIKFLKIKPITTKQLVCIELLSLEPIFLLKRYHLLMHVISESIKFFEWVDEEYYRYGLGFYTINTSLLVEADIFIHNFEKVTKYDLLGSIRQETDPSKKDI